MIVPLALKDIRHDIGAFIGLSVALAAVLVPLVLVGALKVGITGALLNELRNDPGKLRLTFQNDKTISPDMLAEISALDGVGFISPLGRQVAETVSIETPDLRNEAATLEASGQGDPLLRGFDVPQPDEIVISSRLSDALDLAVGDTAIVVLSNRFTNTDYNIGVTIIGVSDALKGRFTLAHPDLTLAVQAVAAGTAVPAFDIPGRPPVSSVPEVTRLRLYAASLADVGPLSRALERKGFIIASAAQEIEGVLNLERNLDWLLRVFVAVASMGYVLALGLSLWVNIQRKRKSLAMLRLMGLSSRNMVLFPAVQAATLAGIGTLIALLITAISILFINRQFSDALPSDANVASFSLSQLLVIIVLTGFGIAVASFVAGRGIAKLQPKEALRDG